MRFLYKIIEELGSAWYGLKAYVATSKTCVAHAVPFVSQFTTPDSAELLLKQGIDPADDPEWQLSGAESPEEYKKWCKVVCGMAATSMVFEYFYTTKHSPIALAKAAKEHGVYHESNGQLSDMHYRPYVTWVRTLGIQAQLLRRLSLGGIEYALSKGSLVIVSVNPNIRGYATAPVSQKGGHLVLVTGYNHANDTITINNPSGFAGLRSDKGHELSTKVFVSYFAGRGIVLSSV